LKRYDGARSASGVVGVKRTVCQYAAKQATTNCNAASKQSSQAGAEQQETGRRAVSNLGGLLLLVRRERVALGISGARGELLIDLDGGAASARQTTTQIVRAKLGLEFDFVHLRERVNELVERN
jgi:uncharacterized protein GlcG (DUF336 family)